MLVLCFSLSLLMRVIAVDDDNDANGAFVVDAPPTIAKETNSLVQFVCLRHGLSSQGHRAVQVITCSSKALERRYIGLWTGYVESMVPR